MEYIKKYKEIVNKLHSTKRKENLIILLEMLAQSAFYSLIVFFLTIILETFAKGDTNFRTVLISISIITFFTTLIGFNYQSILRLLNIKGNPNNIDIALRIGEYYSDIRDNLCNVIQLIPNIDNSKGTSKELILAAFNSIQNRIDEINFDIIIDKNKLKKYFLLLLLIFTISSISITIFNNSLGDGFYRLTHFRTQFLPPVPFEIKLENKFISKIRGENLVIKILASGNAPNKIILNIKENQQDNFDKIILKLEENYYKYEIPSVKNSMTFFAEANWLNSSILTEIGNIKIIDKPILRSLNGKVFSPSYTGLGTQSFTEQNADITCLKGSRINLNLIANKELDSAFLMIENQIFSNDSNKSNAANIDHIKLKVNDRTAQGDFQIKNSCKYWVRLIDKDKQENDAPIKYSVLALQDENPSISLLEPKFDVQLNQDGMLEIKLQINDDYGFSNLKLMSRMTESAYASPDKNYKQQNININKNEKDQEIYYTWDLNKLNIAPEDKYEFYCEVFDNDIISGPKSAKTQIISVRLPSLDELFTENEKDQKVIEKDLEKLMKEAKELRNNIEELNKDILKDAKKKELDWKEKKKAEDIIQKQKELGEKLDQIKENLDKATDKLENNNIISPETLEKYKELQNLMKEINSPEFKRMQEKMQEAMKNISPEDMKKALEEFKFSDENFRKSIERTMKILKRIQAEQKADALTKRAEDLQKRQEENQANKDKENAAKTQEKLSDDLNKMNKELKELEDLMKEIGDKEMPMDELEKAKEDLDFNKTSNEMKEAKENIEKGDTEKAKQNQKNANQNLSKFANQMQKLKDKMKKKNSQEAMKQMEKNINNLLELSKKQEKLKNSTSKSDFNSTRMPQLAKEQVEAYESLSNIANSMMQLSEKSFAITPDMAEQISDALQEMRESVESLADRQPNSATQSQQEAMASMNNAVGKMQSMLQNMKQNNGSCSNPGGSGSEGEGEGQGGSGFGQKMQQMAAQQQALNDAMQKLGQGKGSGAKMSQEQRSEMQRLSEKQNGLQKSMQQLADEQKQFGNAKGDKSKIDEINKLTKELNETMSNMKSSGIKDETLKRQEKILSRLLDITKSINERDFEKNRESKSAKDYNLQSPNEIDFSTQEGKKQFIKEFQKNNSKEFSKDFENLIRIYYELLNK